MITSIVQELQREALDSHVPITDLLRKAKLVATKLDLKDFLIWIENEQSGYEVEDFRKLPKYRLVAGETKAWNPFHGWQPILFTSEDLDGPFFKRGVDQAIGALEEMSRNPKSEMLLMDFAPQLKKQIMESIGVDTDVRFIVPRAALQGVMDGVRNLVLDWSLKLEKAGITGENMTFSPEEKKKAHESGSVYNIQNFTGNIGNVEGNANIETHQNVGLKIEDVQALLAEIEKVRSTLLLNEAQNREVDSAILIAKEEIAKPQPERGRLTGAIKSIKNIVENISGNIGASAILSFIHKLLIS